MAETAMNETLNKKGHGKKYGIRAFALGAYSASNGLQAGVIGYLTYYLTDSALLGAGIVGAMIACAKIVDLFSDFVAGFIVDHTHTKWGKARPYSIASVFMWACVVLLFSVPSHLSSGMKITYAFIMYLLTDSVFRTLLTSSEPVHLRKGFNEKEQVDVVGSSGLIAGLISMVGNAALPTLIANFESQPHGWTIITLIMAIPCGLLGLTKLFFIPERYGDTQSKADDVSLKLAFKTLLKNKYIFIYELTTILVVCLNSMGAIGTYYFTYIVGDLSKLTIVGLMSIASMLFMPFLPVLGRKLGKTEFIKKALIVAAVTQVFMLIFPGNVLVLSIVVAIRVCCILPQTMLNNLMIIDCMKYTEWQTGVKLEGVMSAVSSAANKIGGAIASVLAGVFLQMAGYDGSLAVQSASATAAIKGLYLIYPLVVEVLAIIILHFYKLEEKMPQVEAELAARKEARD